jgi:hypothetical protein
MGFGRWINMIKLKAFRPTAFLTYLAVEKLGTPPLPPFALIISQVLASIGDRSFS